MFVFSLSAMFDDGGASRTTSFRIIASGSRGNFISYRYVQENITFEKHIDLKRLSVILL